MAQPPRDTWQVEMISQRTESGLVLFEYAVREAGGDLFLWNNHRAQFRTGHQRLERDGDGKSLHVSGVAVADADKVSFLESDAAAYRWVDKDGAGNWRDDRGRVLAPYIFAAAVWAGGQDEELDPQWQREQFTVPPQGQIDDAIQRFLDRAEAKGWVGDRRGTTLNVKVGAGADDAWEKDDGTGFDGIGDDLSCSASSNASLRRNTGLRFDNVTVPNGATINDPTTLSIWCLNTFTDDIDADILCEDVDDAANFVDTADVTSRARTGVGGTWVADSLGIGKATSPTFHSAMQTVVNRGGWASGQAMVVFLDGLDSVSETTTLDSYEGNTMEAAEIDIDYTEAATSDQEFAGTLTGMVPDQVPQPRVEVQAY